MASRPLLGESSTLMHNHQCSEPCPKGAPHGDSHCGQDSTSRGNQLNLPRRFMAHAEIVQVLLLPSFVSQALHS